MNNVAGSRAVGRLRAASTAATLLILLGTTRAVHASPFKAAMQKGEVAFDAGKVAQAERAFSEAIKLRPRDASGYYQRAVCRERLGQIAGALKDYSAAIRLQPSLAQAHNNLAALLYRRTMQATRPSTKALTRAERHLRRAMRLEPGYAEAVFNLGLVLSAQEKWEGAEDAFAKAARLMPNDADAQYRHGLLLYQLGRLDKAAEAIARAVALQPGSGRAQAVYGELLLAQGRLRDAQTALKKATRLEPKYYRAHKKLWRVLVKRRAFAEALRRIRKWSPQTAQTLAEAGYVLRAWGKKKRARAKYQAALRKQPDYKRARLSLASLYVEQRRCKAARSILAPLLEQPAAPSGDKHKRSKRKQATDSKKRSRAVKMANKILAACQPRSASPTKVGE